MTGYRGWTETNRVVDPLTPETLRPMLLGAGEFVVVDHPARGADFVARATRTDTERWVVETRLGTDAPTRQTAGVNSDAAFDILRSWAAGDGWWEEAFTWTPVEPG